jgi:hypothetical protein
MGSYRQGDDSIDKALAFAFDYGFGGPYFGHNSSHRKMTSTTRGAKAEPAPREESRQVRRARERQERKHHD